MPQAMFRFPNGFLWGTATAAHQVEGNNTNNTWWAWEQQEGRILHGHKSGLACDWWGGRWQEDFDRAVETHQNAHRLSVEWSRIQPAPDRWNEGALDVYRDMVRYLTSRNVTPMVTLHHFSDPLWFSEQGGWENEKSIEAFTVFVRKVVDALREYVNLWVTINEPNVYLYGGYMGGGFPPGKNDINLAFRVMENMIRAHAAAYRAIHAIQPEGRVGTSINYRSMVPATPWNPLDRWAASVQSQIFNDMFPRAILDGSYITLLSRKRISEAIGTQDFVGINYYTRDHVTFDLGKPGALFGRRELPKEAALSDTGFIANVPDGMGDALKWGLKFKVPIIVTENGVEDADDDLRPTYTIQHIHQVWRAINNNWPIKGYFHWSLVDNFEWERGWTQRFGLWELDENTQARRRRASVDVYDTICKENGISTELIDKYAPGALKKYTG